MGILERPVTHADLDWLLAEFEANENTVENDRGSGSQSRQESEARIARARRIISRMKVMVSARNAALPHPNRQFNEGAKGSNNG